MIPTKVKPALFFWAYEGETLRHDPVMTRARAAAMLRSWRGDGYILRSWHDGVFQRWEVRHGHLTAVMVLAKNQAGE